MADRLSAAEFLERVRSSWDDWYQLVACITVERASETGFHKDWTLTDVMAHIMWYEREMIGLLEARRFTGSDLWELPTDERNEVIRAETAGRAHPEILDEMRSTHARLDALLAEVTDDELYDPGAFPGMPPDWMLALILEGNTFDHYEGHAELVREHLARRNR